MNLFRRAAFAALALVALCSAAIGAGSIQLSGTQQFSTTGAPLSGGLLYTFQSGTSTPQSAYQDQALTIPYANPMVLDASGRAPFFYLADGNIKIRLTDSTGVTIIAADGLLVIGPSLGGGGGAGVDATTVLATGDTKARYGTGVLSGFVRMNGRTLGSATSGATERANSDAQALFEYLWTTDANLVVSSGRGGSANSDWLANKTITLPDMRGRVLAGMDDMGSSAASRLTSTYWGTSAIVLGAAGGSESLALTIANLPDHSHANTLTNGSHTHSITDPSHGHSITDPGHTHVQDTHTAIGGPSGGGTAVNDTGLTGANLTGSSATGVAVVGNFTGINGTNANAAVVGINNAGCTSSACVASAHRTVGPSMVVTIYLKL